MKYKRTVNDDNTKGKCDKKGEKDMETEGGNNMEKKVEGKDAGRKLKNKNKKNNMKTLDGSSGACSSMKVSA